MLAADRKPAPAAFRSHRRTSPEAGNLRFPANPPQSSESAAPPSTIRGGSALSMEHPTATHLPIPAVSALAGEVSSGRCWSVRAWKGRRPVPVQRRRARGRVSTAFVVRASRPRVVCPAGGLAEETGAALVFRARGGARAALCPPSAFVAACAVASWSLLRCSQRSGGGRATV
jgi:hypothetical protein